MAAGAPGRFEELRNSCTLLHGTLHTGAFQRQKNVCRQVKGGGGGGRPLPTWGVRSS